MSYAFSFKHNNGTTTFFKWANFQPRVFTA